MKKQFSIVIAAKNLFDSVAEKPEEGYVCISHNQIVKRAAGKPDQAILEQAENVLTFDEGLVMPGIVDTHTFFTGYAVFHLGADVAAVDGNEAGLKILKEYEAARRPAGALLGHGWNPQRWAQADGERMLEQEYPDKAVILFSQDRSGCIMNQCARDTYHFTAESCYPEKYYRVMSEYLNDRDFIEQEFRDYMQLMNSKGVTAVKEMGFDDFYGFTDYLKAMEVSPDLNLRIFFMSQPVGERMNLEFARNMRRQFTGNTIRFSGFNCMTDGSIADYRGDLKQPYENRDFTCGVPIDYQQIQADVLAADAEGFRFSLHAQGDGAVGKIADIYDQCQKCDGKLIQNHAITDLEFTDPADLERLGRMGVHAEVYFQIMSLDPADVWQNTIRQTIGTERGKNYWNRRKMLDAGLNVSGATDLPLMITDVPDSIYYSCGGYMDGLDVPFLPGNTITVAEILKAWTIGGQRNLGMEHVLGTLEEGKLADITVFDQNLFETDFDRVRSAKVVMTVMDGRIVYRKEG